ncbi:putative FBD-associated F-box protein At5g56690 isoform X1 [Cornus florida]|uniref:putative FBD-associated F-box protein At5g56690 isoform X1 n=1 Tax=Cornus florida TaxID=4283 RepID=UPI00289FF2BE|nr:putative FBD-associated F-box protein At5g56690 isoform X1 [Cornus florida]XP_059662713.1 putative FBD-associated F-box protein At5g56690 isoform X1 [Cornus florida]XP_059662720.1 putative FBD-associated F-box protein At5g56690 isoform X1 [Cornus florida]
MRNIGQCTSSFKQQKRKEHMKNGISGLPDDIIIAILSLLTLKEAARTSVLSRRWRYLWRYLWRYFNFDSKIFRAPSVDGTSLEEPPKYRSWLSNISHFEEPTKYVSWVNKVLELHLGAFIDEMRISFCFRGDYPRDIGDWIKFAMEKGVRRFELDVMAGRLAGPGLKFYNFPSLESFKCLFRTSNSHHVSRTIGFTYGFCSLTTLRLAGVNIMEEVLEHILSICVFLEQLCIVGSTSLVNLKIAGPSLKLKHLELSQCHSLEKLEISAINLVSFTYFGRDISVPFKNVPLLSELSIGGRFCSSFVFESYKHSSYIAQIEKLKLQVFVEDFHRFPKYFRALGNLKEVELFVMGNENDSLLSLTSVIKAAPKLSKFTVELMLSANDKRVRRADQIAAINAEKEATKCHHQCLKVVELVDFGGRSCSEVELVLHILVVAASLEKIIIHPFPFLEYKEVPPIRAKLIEDVRKRAWQIKTILPKTIELVVPLVK